MRPADDGSGHVASLAGDADVLVESQGRLKAGELHLWLDIVPGTRPALPAKGVGAGLSGVKPARMLARTMVEIDVEQLTARTDKMEVWFRHTDTSHQPAVKLTPVHKPHHEACFSRRTASATAEMAHTTGVRRMPITPNTTINAPRVTRNPPKPRNLTMSVPMSW